MLPSQELPSRQTPGHVIIPPDWQNTLGRLMVDSDTGTGRSVQGGPTDSLKKTLEHIGKLTTCTSSAKHACSLVQVAV